MIEAFDRITKGRAVDLVEAVTGVVYENLSADVVEYDMDKINAGDEMAQAMFHSDHTPLEMVIKFDIDDTPDGEDFYVIIHDDGGLSFTTPYNGCKFMLHNPLRVYRILLEAFDPK